MLLIMYKWSNIRKNYTWLEMALQISDGFNLHIRMSSILLPLKFALISLNTNLSAENARSTLTWVGGIDKTDIATS